MADKIILFDNPEAAQPITVSGWRASTGQFFTDEQTARWAGCTHIKCDCGSITRKMYLKCDTCRTSDIKAKYQTLPHLDWDGETPLCLYMEDTYFFSEDDIDDFCEEYQLNPSDLMLMICVPIKASWIDEDFWSDELPEDGEIPDELRTKLKELNSFIDTLAPLSWTEGAVRTSYNPQP